MYQEWQIAAQAAGQAPPTRSFFQGGRPLNDSGTSQGGGAPMGGGMTGGGPVLATGSWWPTAGARGSK